MKIYPIFKTPFKQFNYFKINKINKTGEFNGFKTNNTDCFASSGISFKNKDFNQKLNEKLNSSQEELILFLYEELQKRAKELKVSTLAREDLIQRKILEILEYLNIESDKDKIREFILANFNDFKLKATDYTTDMSAESLDRRISRNYKKNVIDTMTENNLISCFHDSCKEKKEEKRKEFQGLLDKSDLSEEEKKIIIKRFIKGATYQNLSDEDQKSQMTIYTIIIRGILKLQQSMGKLPDKFKTFVCDFKNTFYPNKNLKDVENRLINAPAVVNKDIKELIKRVDDVVDEFKNYGLTRENYLEAVFKHIDLFTLTAEKIKSNINNIINDEFFRKNGLSPKGYIKAALRQPQLFYLKAKTIKENIKGVVDDEFFRKNGLSEKEYIEAALSKPQLFCMKAKTVKENIKGVVDDEFFKENGLSPGIYIETALKQPSLFYQKAETVREHIKIQHLIKLDKLYTHNKTPSGDELVNVAKHKLLTLSSRNLYLLLLKQKVFERNNIPAEIRGQNQSARKITEYYTKLFKENPDLVISFNIINHPQTQSFIKFLEEFSNEISGKNHFKVKIINE